MARLFHFDSTDPEFETQANAAEAVPADETDAVDCTAHRFAEVEFGNWGGGETACEARVYLATEPDETPELHDVITIEDFDRSTIKQYRVACQSLISARITTLTGGGNESCRRRIKLTNEVQ